MVCWLRSRTASATRRAIYSQGLTAETVARFRARLAQPEERAQLSTFFGMVAADLNDVLAEAYQRLEADRRGWDAPPAQLCPG